MPGGTWATLLFCMLGAGLVGCGKGEASRTDLTSEDYKKVRIGMPVKEFKSLFADHNISKNQSMKVENGSNRGVLTYSSGGRSITVEFVDGKVVSRSQVVLEAAETKLYQSFEGDRLREKYSSRFEHAAGGGGRSNVHITPPGHVFKDFNVRGKISEDHLEQVLKDLRAELSALAKAGGVEVTQEPKEGVQDRLNVLPYAMFKDEYSGGLRGFHFAYRQGVVAGAVDVLAGCTTGGGGKEWMLVCSVHEAAP